MAIVRHTHNVSIQFIYFERVSSKQQHQRVIRQRAEWTSSHHRGKKKKNCENNRTHRGKPNRCVNNIPSKWQAFIYRKYLDFSRLPISIVHSFASIQYRLSAYRWSRLANELVCLPPAQYRMFNLLIPLSQLRRMVFACGSEKMDSFESKLCVYLRRPGSVSKAQWQAIGRKHTDRRCNSCSANWSSTFMNLQYYNCCHSEASFASCRNARSLRLYWRRRGCKLSAASIAVNVCSLGGCPFLKQHKISLCDLCWTSLYLFLFIIFFSDVTSFCFRRRGLLHSHLTASDFTHFFPPLILFTAPHFQPLFFGTLNFLSCVPLHSKIFLVVVVEIPLAHSLCKIKINKWKFRKKLNYRKKNPKRTTFSEKYLVFFNEFEPEGIQVRVPRRPMRDFALPCFFLVSRNCIYFFSVEIKQLRSANWRN